MEQDWWCANFWRAGYNAMQYSKLVVVVVAVVV